MARKRRDPRSGFPGVSVTADTAIAYVSDKLARIETRLRRIDAIEQEVRKLQNIENHLDRLKGIENNVNRINQHTHEFVAHLGIEILKVIVATIILACFVAVVVFFGFDLGLGERFVEWLRNLGRKH